MTYTTSNVIEKPKSKTALAKEAAARTRAIIADSYTATELKRRGWSEAFIAAHLGAEDATRSNRGTLACYYLRDRVHAIEATPAFAERKITTAKNSPGVGRRRDPRVGNRRRVAGGQSRRDG